MDLWIGLMRDWGITDQLVNHWFFGRTAVPKTERWSVIRDVLHWVD